MNHSTRFARVLLAGLAAASLAVGMATDAVHAGSKPKGPEVPSTLAVEAGNRVFLVAHASGVQIYSCNATSTALSWGLVAPRANLYDDRGRLIGTHYAGPTWQAKDGSTVLGQRVDGVTVDPTAIPWLLISAVSTTESRHGDRLADTTFIQRVATTGGLAPAATDCNAATAGATAEVPYTADYFFWKSTCRRPG